MRYYIQTLFLFLFFSSNLSGQFYQSVFPNLAGTQLTDATIDEFKPDRVLNYARARDTMYSKIYRVQDSVTGIYSNHKVFLPEGVDPSTFLYKNGSNDGINAEHVFPQSKGADEDNGNPHSDLHHIFPARTRVNMARSNFLFREIPDDETTTWFFKNKSTSQRPTANRDLYSERINGSFEPPELQKGNIARAMFYFYTMYQQEADAADPIFFDSQRQVLCDWHNKDPVESLEWARTFLIGNFQDSKPNPFVLDCSLAARIYCPLLAKNCFDLSAERNLISILENPLTIFPNPAKDFINIQISLKEAAEVSFNFYDALGQKIFSSDIKKLMPGNNQITLPAIGSNFLILEAIISDFNYQEVIRKKVILVD